MGGNTTNRVDWKELEIHDLVLKYKSQDHEFFNPITCKILKNRTSWKSSIACKMSFTSANLFFFLLEPPHFSKLSNTPLTVNEYNYRTRGFSNYTTEETQKRLYMSLRDYTISDNTKRKISNTLLAFNSSEKGKEQRLAKSTTMKRFYSTVEGKIHKRKSSIKSSVTMKQKIRSGEFMPPITNTWTHWNAVIIKDGNSIKFRSSWEACFWFCNQHMKYETIRVQGKDQTYISDFYDEVTNTLYEIKPVCRYNIEIDKMNCLINYCTLNNNKFVWENNRNISKFL